MTLLATKENVFSEFTPARVGGVFPNYGIEQVTAYESSQTTYNWGDVLVRFSDTQYRQVLASDIAVKLTPTVANSTAYSIVVKTNAISRTYTYTSDGSATAAEIVDGLVALINADTTMDNYVTSANVSNVLHVTEVVPCGLEVTSVGAGVLAVTNMPSELVVVSGDSTGDGLNYSNTVAATTNTTVTVRTKGEWYTDKLTFGDSITGAKLASLKAILKNRGFDLLTKATVLTTKIYG